MSKSNRLIKGAAILTITGFITRIIGFFYRIFLSHTIGAEGMGIFQLIFPVLTLCYAFTSMGMQTALSNCIASRLAVNDKKGAKDVFCCGLILSLILSVFVSFFIYTNAEWLCTSLLEEPRCIPLLQLMSLSIPFGTMHICISSYHFAKRETKIPAIAQLIEQLVRVLSSWGLYYFFVQKGFAVTPIIAVAGLVLSDVASFIFVFILLKLDLKKDGYSISSLQKPFRYLNEISHLAVPLTANRVLIHLLKSVETMMIPARLRLFGLSVSGSLSVYGVFTGMALPLIFFPSAITNSVAVMLLPAIAESKAQNNTKAIGMMIDKTIKYCLLLGILSCGLFYIYGDDIGLRFFGNADAGNYIQVLAFLCPFLYLNTTLSSVINGLGKTTVYFVQNMLGLGIRILFVYFMIPRFGITGYLWGILANEIILCIMCLVTLARSAELSFSAFDCLIKPLAALAVSVGVARFTENLCAQVPGMPPLLTLVINAGVMVVAFGVLLLCVGVVHVPKMGKEKGAVPRIMG